MFKLPKRLLLFSVNHYGVLKALMNNRGLGIQSLRFITCSVHRLSDANKTSLLFSPVPVTLSDETGTGSELVGKLNKPEILKALNVFYRKNELKSLSYENGFDDHLLQTGFSSFRKYCLETENLPADLHIILSDICNGAGNHIDIFPYFLRHVREMFPHLEYMEDLKKIGDLRSPANWYPQTRNLQRKIFFHSGPTNSGKTYHAIKSFMESKSGIYCAPLKLLAVEIYNKTNDSGTPCDLFTGEEVLYANPNGDVSNHVSCTIEMCSVEKMYDVAVIDEIQMIKDVSRGWAWTRALLGIKAKEIHLCGEESTINLIDSILCTTNERLEVKSYKRLTALSVVDSIEDFANVQPGDCIVCFNKNDIFRVTQILENNGVDVAVIYGSLPPGTKLAQCKKFNDPNDPCNVLVATDAIGMGLNLSIRRVIFYSLIKPSINEKGEIEKAPLSVSQALQIAGRAGRYGCHYSEGFTTTFKSKELPLLKELLSKTPEPVLSAGLLPTLEQIEMYSYYLPNSSLCNLIKIFINFSTVDDSLYFICDLTDFKFLAEMLEHVPLPLRVKYTLCCSPVNRKSQFACTMLMKFAKLISINNVVTIEWLCKNIGWPVQFPKNTQELLALEGVHDVLDLYLWLSYRFPEYFPDPESVKSIQVNLDKMIQDIDLLKLLKSSDLESDVNLSYNKTAVRKRKLLMSKPFNNIKLNLQHIMKCGD